VRLLLTAAVLLCAILLLPPTAAGRPRAPFDFERAASPTGGARAAGSGIVATPRRFHLVGMRWRGRARPAIALRVRRPDGSWSRWERLGSHAAGGSDPLWVGAADAVQYRLDRRVRGLRLHFVNVASELGRRPRARTAQEAQPDVVSRADWGAGGCRPRAAPEYGAVKAVHVHHTVSLNDYAPEEGPAIVLAICRFHRNSNGWNDIGYNALVDKYGVLYEGRAGGLDQPVIGAQAQGFNAQTAGIASIADHTDVEAGAETLEALARYISWKLGVHGLPLSGRVTLTSAGGPASRFPAGARVTVERVIGHRDTGKTACPGALLYGQLEQLRALVATGVAGVPSFATRLSATLADFSVDHGDPVPVSGLLSGPGGAPLAGESVEVQANSDGSWKRAARTVTAPDGSFATELRPRKRMYLRLRYPGRPGLRRATSARLLLRVRALVTLQRPARTGVPGRRVRLSGTVAPRKRFVRLVVRQHVSGRYRRVGARSVSVRRGRFSTSFVPAFADSYRYALVAPGDEDTDRGSTGWVGLRVRR
jgi:hypothetical protein